MDDAANGAEGERLDSLVKTDWSLVRATALDCLNATWGMVCWAERSQQDDYDTASAALHLSAIDQAHNTFRLAMEVLLPGFESATSDQLRHSPVFDALAVASVGEGPRPDFGICSTAHEKAFEVLRLAILWVENGLNDELERRDAPDSCLEGIEDLHKRSPVQLRDDLQRLEKNESLQSALSARQLRTLRAWVGREWAAVATTTNIGETSKRSPNQTTHEQKVERILNRLRLRSSTKGETKRGHSKYLNEKKNDAEWSKAHEEALAKFNTEIAAKKSASKN